MADDKYDGFLSYSHAVDGKLAPALQTGVERFAKRWNRTRAMRIFRDQTSLSADPSLWQVIERALARSIWFVLLASPEAAASVWVNREVDWWLRNRDPGRMLIVVTGGDLRWNEALNGFDPVASTALPPALRRAFRAEPLWVDARWAQSAEQLSKVNPDLQDAVASIAATIRGVPKDELVGTAIREHRHTMRLARSAQTALAVLLIASIVAAIVAVTARNDAVDQARIATARALAAEGEGLAARDPVLAARLAVAGYRLDSSPQTISALMREMDRHRHDAGYLERAPDSSGSEGRVFERSRAGEVAISPDGELVAVGPHEGSDIRLWHTADNRLAAVLPSGVSGSGNVPVRVAFTADGTRLGVMWGSSAEVWDVASRERTYSRRMPDSFIPELVSPDGGEIGLINLEVDGRLEGAYVTATTSLNADIVPLAKGAGAKKALRDRLGLPVPAATLSDDTSVVETYDRETGRRLEVKQLFGSMSHWTAVAAGGNTVVAADDQGQLVALDSSLDEVWQLGQMPSTVLYLDVSHDGSLAVATDNTGNVLLLRPTVDRRFDILPGTGGRVDGEDQPEEQWLVPSPNGRHLLIHRPGRVELWRLDERRLIAEYPTDRPVAVPAALSALETSAIAFNTDGTRFAIAANGRVTTRTTESLREVATAGGTDARATVLGDAGRLPAPGKNTLRSRFGSAVVLAERGTIQVWSAGQKLGEAGYNEHLSSLAVSRDGAHLVVGGSKPQADVVELATGKRTPLVGGYGVSPDPQGTEHAFVGASGLIVQQVTPNRDADELRNRLLVWHQETGSLIGEWQDPYRQTFPGQQDFHVVVAGDHTALTVLVNGAIAAWRVSPEAWADSLCEVFGDFDPQQQDRYQPEDYRGNVCR